MFPVESIIPHIPRQFIEQDADMRRAENIIHAF